MGRRVRTCAAVLVASCGRIGFDTGVTGDGNHDDGKIAITTNIAFITHNNVIAANLGSVAAADARCMDDANAARIPGTYIAWISTSTSNARDRLGNARGWRRPDGAPFADTVTALVT